MKELSVVVLGGGRWARALTVLLTHNQHKQRGRISRVIAYAPSEDEGGASDEAPQQLRAEHVADTHDATMMGIPAESMAALASAPGGKVPRVHIKSDSNDATMMGMTAESMAALASAPGGKVPRVQIKSDSNDATMMAMTAESMAALASAPGGKARHVKSDSNDATMMGMTADSMAGLAGAPSGEAPRASLESSSDDATMMHLTAESLAGAVGKNKSRQGKLADVGTADLVLLAAPATAVQKLLRHVSSVLRPQQMLVHCIDGFFPADPVAGQPARLISQLIRKETPITLIGALAGPAHPEDMEEWCPAALVCGTPMEAVAIATRQVLACPSLRIYTGADLIGVEVARAMSSVVALASGICDILEFGIATRATLVSRSAAEIARMGIALGGNERTFVGLAGVGGLMVASMRRDSPDFRLGQLIGAGVGLDEALKQIGQPCDSANMIRDAHGVTQAWSLKAPILTTLYRMVFGKIEIAKALRELLDNPNYTE